VTSEKSEKTALSSGKTTCKQLRKMTGSNVWAAETGCMISVLHKKTNASAVVESYCESCKVVLDSRRPLASIDLTPVEVIEKIFNGSN